MHIGSNCNKNANKTSKLKYKMNLDGYPLGLKYDAPYQTLKVYGFLVKPNNRYYLIKQKKSD